MREGRDRSNHIRGRRERIEMIWFQTIEWCTKQTNEKSCVHWIRRSTTDYGPNGNI